jgi:hypothetical protein
MELTKTIIELHQLFDTKTLNDHIVNSINDMDEFRAFSDVSTVLNLNVYNSVVIGDKKYMVRKLVHNFNDYLNEYLFGNFWTRIYLGIVEKILSLNDQKHKESLISDIVYLLMNLELDARDIYEHHKYMLESYYAEDGQDIEEKHFMIIIENHGCTNPFELVYYSVVYSHLLNIIEQLKLRFSSYIDENIYSSIYNQSSPRRWALGIDLNETVKKKVQDIKRIEWAGSGAELAELAAALIATDSLVYRNSDNNLNDGKIGAYLFMLFDVKEKLTTDQYYRYLNDIKQRKERVIFIDHLKTAFETYLEEGRKTEIKRRKKGKQSD